MTRASWCASFGARLRNTTRGMHLASCRRVHRVDDYDLPRDVPVRIVGAFDQIQSITTPD